GTLVAVGSSAGVLAKEKDGIGATRLLADCLGKMDDYRQAIVREWEGRTTKPEAERVWSFLPPTEVVYPWLIGEGGDKPNDDELKRRDAWRDIFMPGGRVLAGRVDDRSWLTGGCHDYVPVIYTSDTVLLAPPSVQVPVRMGYFSPAAAPAAPAKKDTKKDEKKEKPAP